MLNFLSIVVSHNIGFINNFSDHIISIEDTKLNVYRGNYYNYKKQRSQFLKSKKKVDEFIKEQTTQ